MKGKYLIAIAFLASWTVVIANKLSANNTAIFFGKEAEEAEEAEVCPVRDTCPPKLISHEYDCSKYYECNSGHKLLRSCPTGLYFSQKWRGCVIWDISDCVSTPPTQPTPPTRPTPPTPPTRPTPPTPPTRPTPPPSGDQCPATDTCPPKLISHEYDCSKYYECSSGHKLPRSCPTGLYFSQKWRGCVIWEISDCGRPPTTTPTPTPTPTTPTTTTPRDACINGDLLPHECNCTSYYLCINGRKALRSCPAGRRFDPSTKTCVPGDCGSLVCLNGDVKKHDCDCDKYFRCNNDEWFLEQCENGQHFSEARKTCTSPREALCEVIPDDCSVDGVLLPHECRCAQYYECKNGRKALRYCPTGQYFDPSTRRCELGSCVSGTRKRLR